MRAFFLLLIQKGNQRGGKYVKRLPTGNPKNPWKYFYGPSTKDKAPAVDKDTVRKDLKNLTDSLRLRAHDGKPFSGNARFNSDEANRHHAALVTAIDHVPEESRAGLKQISDSLRTRNSGGSGASFSASEAKSHHSVLSQAISGMETAKPQTYGEKLNSVGAATKKQAKEIDSRKPTEKNESQPTGEYLERLRDLGLAKGSSDPNYAALKEAHITRTKKNTAMPKGERLAKIFRKIGGMKPASNHAEAASNLTTAIEAIENKHSGIPNNPSSMTDGRMYPAQSDRIKQHPERSDVKVHEHTGHETHIANNGAIEIRLKSGQRVFRKKGQDGKHVY